MTFVRVVLELCPVFSVTFFLPFLYHFCTILQPGKKLQLAIDDVISNRRAVHINGSPNDDVRRVSRHGMTIMMLEPEPCFCFEVLLVYF